MATQGASGDKKQLDGQEQEWAGDEQSMLTILQAHYLRKLEHQIDLKNLYQSDPDREEWLLKGVNKAAYSAFRDCVDNGLEEQAKELITAERQAN